MNYSIDNKIKNYNVKSMQPLLLDEFFEQVISDLKEVTKQKDLALLGVIKAVLAEINDKHKNNYLAKLYARLRELEMVDDIAKYDNKIRDIAQSVMLINNEIDELKKKAEVLFGKEYEDVSAYRSNKPIKIEI